MDDFCREEEDFDYERIDFLKNTYLEYNYFRKVSVRVLCDRAKTAQAEEKELLEYLFLLLGHTDFVYRELRSFSNKRRVAAIKTFTLMGVAIKDVDCIKLQNDFNNNVRREIFKHMTRFYTEV